MSSLTYVPYNKQSFMVLGDKAKYSAVLKTIGARWNTRLKGGPGWTVPLAKEAELKKIVIAMAPKESPVQPRKAQKKYHRAISEPTESEPSNPEPAEPVVEEEPAPVTPKEVSAEEEKEKSPILDETIEKQRRRFEKEKRAYENEKMQERKPEHRQEKTKEERKPEHRQEKTKEERKPEHRQEKTKEERKPVHESEHRRERHEHVQVKVEHRQEKTKPDRHEREKSGHKSSRHERDQVKYYQSFAEKPSKFRQLYEPSSDGSDSGYTSSSRSSSSSDDYPMPEKHRARANQDDHHQLRTKIHDLEKQLEKMRGKKHRG